MLAAERLGLGRTASAISGLLFALHPIHTENVAWIAGRTDILAFLLTLASLLAHLAADRKARGWPLAWRMLSLALFASALLAKEMAAVLPLWIAAVAWSRDRRDWRAMARAAAPSMLVLAGYLLLRFVGLDVAAPEAPPSHSLARALASAPWTILRYLSWLAFPTELSAYVRNPYVTTLTDIRFWGAAFVLGALGWALARAGRKRREVALFGLLLASSFAPILNLQRLAGQEEMGNVMAERFCYFPSFPFLALAVLGGEAAFAALRGPRARTALVALFAFALAACARGTWTRQAAWRDDRTLFEDEARRAPDAAMPWTQLCQIALHEGKLEEADRHLRRAEALEPDSVGVAVMRAQWLVFAGRYAEALPLQTVVVAEHGRRNHAARNNLAFLLRATGDFEGARSLLEELVAALPDYADPHFNLGELRRAQGDLRGSAAELRRYHELRPEDPRGLAGLADVEVALGDREAVESLYRGELERKGEDASTLNALALLRHRMGDAEGASSALARALAADPGYVRARFNLALLLDESGRRPEAIAELERILREAPGSEAGRAAAAQLESWRGTGRSDAAESATMSPR